MKLFTELSYWSALTVRYESRLCSGWVWQTVAGYNPIKKNFKFTSSLSGGDSNIDQIINETPLGTSVLSNNILELVTDDIELDSSLSYETLTANTDIKILKIISQGESVVVGDELLAVQENVNINEVLSEDIEVSSKIAIAPTPPDTTAIKLIIKKSTEIEGENEIGLPPVMNDNNLGNQSKTELSDLSRGQISLKTSR
ncbi:hypothetical protein TKK_0000190 [Trichogramma kaykai]